MTEPMSWAYMAGFFDGEGSVFSYSQKRGTQRGVTFNQKTDKTLRRIKRFLEERGCTSLSLKKDSLTIKTRHWTTEPYVTHQWRIRLSNVHDMRIALEGMLPFLIEKKEKVERFLSEIATIKGRTR
jgi:hypothetical protein